VSTPTQTIDVTALLARLDAQDPLTVVDVRSPAEYESAHIAGAINVPLDILTAHASEVAEHLRGHPVGSVVLVCQSGARAEQACRRLAATGLTGLPTLTGGTTAYLAGGGPVVRGRKRWVLERQVRLVAGVLVAASIVASLGYPGARFLAGAIGAGLALAAVTDTCVMGRALSLLPYNRTPNPLSSRDLVDQLR
jgi:rhodanese-related sulfurtransferase